jgi:hypothetical protein
MAHVMSHFPLPIVDALELDAPVRSLLMPGVAVRDSHARLRRLPRFFYAVESWTAALDTRLTPHFALWEFMDVDLFEPAPLRRFPRYVPCAVTTAGARPRISIASAISISTSARRLKNTQRSRSVFCPRFARARSGPGLGALTITCIWILDTSPPCPLTHPVRSPDEGARDKGQGVRGKG